MTPYNIEMHSDILQETHCRSVESLGQIRPVLYFVYGFDSILMRGGDVLHFLGGD